MLYEKTDKIIQLCNPASPEDIFVTSDWQANIKKLSEIYAIDNVNRFTWVLINLKRSYNVRKYGDQSNNRKNQDAKQIGMALEYLSKAEECLKMLAYSHRDIQKLLHDNANGMKALKSLLQEFKTTSSPGRPSNKLKHQDVINMLVMVYIEITQNTPKCTHSNWEANLYNGEILRFMQDIDSLLGLGIGSEGRIYKNIKKAIESPSVEQKIIYKRMLGI
ncbi:MAG: hypothetical protein A3E85_03145 [Gammaproteobacteria bacterium RIFCSPHIGHO2_12_FULL_45_12]|nr:MAG: hypothetical protein A3E85_03145 [Gammaproteobacteria bacterium RIFCSPHIGHO2_12_FULL_45_12]